MIKTGPPQAPAQNPPDGTAPGQAESHRGNAIIQCVTSEQLLGVRGELKIQHNGDLYSLRRTRQGKLILTK